MNESYVEEGHVLYIACDTVENKLLMHVFVVKFAWNVALVIDQIAVNQRNSVESATCSDCNCFSASH